MKEQKHGTRILLRMSENVSQKKVNRSSLDRRLRNESRDIRIYTVLAIN